MKFAYADPPYLGQARKLYASQNPGAAEVDHAELIARLCRDFPEGWALSCSSPSLRVLLPMCPEGVRVMGYGRTFAPRKPGVSVSYAWEPVLVRGGRPRGRNEPGRPFDWCIGKAHALGGSVARNGFPGEKPPDFCHWVFAVLNAQPGDELADLFPGSGAVRRAWEVYQRQVRIFVPPTAAQLELGDEGEGDEGPIREVP